MSTIGFFRNDENAVMVDEGQVIFQQGEVGDVMYVILEGSINIVSHDKIVDTLGEGEIFGEMALVDENPRSAAAVAASKSKIVPVSKQRFMMAIQHNPFFALQVMGVMASRLRKLMM
jgi:CRP-like cAMP-binding protein